MSGLELLLNVCLSEGKLDTRPLDSKKRNLARRTEEGTGEAIKSENTSRIRKLSVEAEQRDAPSHGVFPSEHPAEKAWTSLEDKQLVTVVLGYAQRKQVIEWDVVAQCLEGRSPKECRYRWINYLYPFLKAKQRQQQQAYTEDEDRLIMAEYERVGDNWDEIARVVNMYRQYQHMCAVQESMHNTRQQYSPQLSPVNECTRQQCVRRVAWSAEEERVLHLLAQEYHKANRDVDWDTVSRHLPGRSAVECHERYNGHPAIINNIKNKRINMNGNRTKEVDAAHPQTRLSLSVVFEPKVRITAHHMSDSPTQQRFNPKTSSSTYAHPQRDIRSHIIDHDEVVPPNPTLSSMYSASTCASANTSVESTGSDITHAVYESGETFDPTRKPRQPSSERSHSSRGTSVESRTSEIGMDTHRDVTRLPSISEVYAHRYQGVYGNTQACCEPRRIVTCQPAVRTSTSTFRTASSSPERSAEQNKKISPRNSPPASTVTKKLTINESGGPTFLNIVEMRDTGHTQTHINTRTQTHTNTHQRGGSSRDSSQERSSRESSLQESSQKKRVAEKHSEDGCGMEPATKKQRTTTVSV